MFRVFILATAIPVMSALLTPAAAQAEIKLTPKGRISAAAVAELFIAADKDPAVRDIAFGYIAGTVETTLATADAARAAGGKPLVCKTGPSTIGAPEILDAFRKVAPDTAKWGEVEAAPIIVSFLITKFPC